MILGIRSASMAGRLGLRSKLTARFSSTRPTFHDKDDFVLTDLEEETGIATLTMNRAPVNSLSLEM
jgi:hypothetical protein